MNIKNIDAERKFNAHGDDKLNSFLLRGLHHQRKDFGVLQKILTGFEGLRQLFDRNIFGTLYFQDIQLIEINNQSNSIQLP